MQIAERPARGSAGDGIGNRGNRTSGPANPGETTGAAPAVAIGGSYDPASRVQLSAETLLFLSRTKRAQEKYPPLTRDEWNNVLSPQLAAREDQVFGKFAEAGDYQAYYRAFISYYDELRPEDQHSLRYFGTREAAIAGLRSVEYEEAGVAVGTEFQTLVSVLLETDTLTPSSSVLPSGAAQAVGYVGGDMFAWDAPAISYEDPTQTRAPLSEIERFYRESF